MSGPRRDADERTNEADDERTLVQALALDAGSARSWLRHTMPRTDDNDKEPRPC